jgi:phage terminase large subunit
LTNVVDIPLLKPQLQFMQSKARELLYSGAFGAGKSRAICHKIVMRARAHPGAREALCRKTNVALKRTTLKTLLQSDGELPPVLEPRTYTHNRSEQTIKLHGGGEIVYFGLDDPQKIGSMNLSGCGVDEAVEVTEADWTMLRGRIRLKIGALPHQLYGACNPGPPSHFLAERFGLALDYVCAPNCEAIHTKATDNPFLPAAYLENLETLQGVSYKRFVLGLWVGSDGLVYDRWDRDVFVQEREGPWKRCIVGCDAGYTNPAAFVLLMEDYDGRLHLASEWYKTKQLEPDVIDQAQHWYELHEPETFHVDPSAASLRAGMHARGMPVLDAVNDVFGGIQSVQARLHVAGDGRPRFTIDPACVNTIREFESYEWRETPDGYIKDEPIKLNDHAMDALRYGIVAIDGLFTARVNVIDFSTPRSGAWLDVENEEIWE